MSSQAILFYLSQSRIDAKKKSETPSFAPPYRRLDFPNLEFVPQNCEETFFFDAAARRSTSLQFLNHNR